MSSDPNLLYYGDNLDVLRRHVKDESIDLVYLDPPFNSNVNYNVLFAEHGTQSAAQIKAFEDTWRWDESAAQAYEETVELGGDVAQALRAFRTLLGTSDMLAYLAMMAPRLVELRRVLKSTGSLYLHCDPSASHYLKLLLDAIFEPVNFRSEIIWKRTSAHSSAKRYGPVHDTILFYSKSGTYTWNQTFQEYEPLYLETFFDQQDDDGRRWKRNDLTGAGIRHGETGQTWRGLDVTAKGRHWAYPPSELDRLDAAGRIHWPKKEGGMPRLKQYPEDSPGVPLQDVWTDIRLYAQPLTGAPRLPNAEARETLRTDTPRQGVTRAKSCSTPSAAAGPRSPSRNASTVAGSGSTSRIWRLTSFGIGFGTLTATRSNKPTRSSASRSRWTTPWS